MKASELTDDQLAAVVEGKFYNGKPITLEPESTGPGKFEGNANDGLAARLHQAIGDTSWLNDQKGSVEFGRWYGLVGRFIVSESDQGFFDYDEHDTPTEAAQKFADIEDNTED